MILGGDDDEPGAGDVEMTANETPQELEALQDLEEEEENQDEEGAKEEEEATAEEAVAEEAEEAAPEEAGAEGGEGESDGAFTLPRLLPLRLTVYLIFTVFFQRQSLMPQETFFTHTLLPTEPAPTKKKKKKKKRGSLPLHPLRTLRLTHPSYLLQFFIIFYATGAPNSDASDSGLRKTPRTML